MIPALKIEQWKEFMARIGISNRCFFLLYELSKYDDLYIIITYLSRYQFTNRLQ